MSLRSIFVNYPSYISKKEFFFVAINIRMLYNYILFAFLFVMIDAIYLINTTPYFNNQVRLIQGNSISLNTLSTFLCYLTLTLGIYYFSIHKNASIRETFWLGIFVYGVFEFTNHAIFNNWKWTTVCMDTLWGGVLFATVVYLFRKLQSLL